MIELSFPWPPKELSPNARVHWATKAKAAKKYKADCWWVCVKSWRRESYLEQLALSVKFHPPSARRADADNMLASCKNLFDAVSKYTGIDDSKFTITFSKAEPVKHGAVKVVIT